MCAALLSPTTEVQVIGRMIRRQIVPNQPPVLLLSQDAEKKQCVVGHGLASGDAAATGIEKRREFLLPEVPFESEIRNEQIAAFQEEHVGPNRFGDRTVLLCKSSDSHPVSRAESEPSFKVQSAYDLSAPTDAVNKVRALYLISAVERQRRTDLGMDGELAKMGLSPTSCINQNAKTSPEESLRPQPPLS